MTWRALATLVRRAGRALRQWTGRTGEDEPLGRRGERLAARYLRREGLTILARNYRCPGGEIDLIALDPPRRTGRDADTICFVEVKTRSDDTYTAPASAVDRAKRSRLKRAAGFYLADHDTRGYVTRFDIVSIVARPGEPPRIDHRPNAFR